MAGINKVILIGHLGQDPELRLLPDGGVILSFPLATSDQVINTGVQTGQTEWHNVVMWRGLAEAAAKVLKKGKLVYLEGKSRTRAYDDKQGIRKYATEIVADSFVLIGRSSDFDTQSQ